MNLLQGQRESIYYQLKVIHLSRNIFKTTHKRTKTLGEESDHGLDYLNSLRTEKSPISRYNCENTNLGLSANMNYPALLIFLFVYFFGVK